MRPQGVHHADYQHTCDPLRGYKQVADYQRLAFLYTSEHAKCVHSVAELSTFLTFFHDFGPQNDTVPKASGLNVCEPQR